MAPDTETLYGYDELSDEELALEEAKLAKQRTETRLRQNALQSVIDVRKALAGLPEHTRRIVKLHVAGGATPTGEARAEKGN